MLTAAVQLGARCPAGAIVLLDGEMGAGKTTWTRGFGEGLGVLAPREIKSPTYTVCMEHRGRVDLIHVDLFRLGESGQVGALSAAFEALGLEELAIGRADAVTVVEWAERWLDPPPSALRLRIERPPGTLDVRTLQVLQHAPWSAGWPVEPPDPT